MEALYGILLILLFAPEIVFASQPDANACIEFIKSKEGNYKIAHKNMYCLKAASEGSHSAQYSVGVGYGLEGRHDLEEKYYRLAAAQENIAAYLGLGHVLSDKNTEEAIYWYKRYIIAIRKIKNHDRSDEYAAKLITRIYKKNKDNNGLNAWLVECNSIFGNCNE